MRKPAVTSVLVGLFAGLAMLWCADTLDMVPLLLAAFLAVTDSCCFDAKLKSHAEASDNSYLVTVGWEINRAQAGGKVFLPVVDGVVDQFLQFALKERVERKHRPLFAPPRCKRDGW